MTATTYTPAKPCKKCGASERYENGNCKQCKKLENAARRATGPRAVKPQVFFLAALPGNRKQIMAATGFCESTMYRCQRALRAQGRVHIGSYIQSGSRMDPVFVEGPGKDAIPQYVPAPKKKRVRKEIVQAPKAASKPGEKPPVITRADIDARIALRPPVPVARLVDAAVTRSREVFPLSSVWG